MEEVEREVTDGIGGEREVTDGIGGEREVTEGCFDLF